MNADIAYCDYNATTPVRPEAAEAVTRALAIGGNPSSVHAAGRAAKALLENAREAVAKGVGARARDVIFTGGATEALQLALEAARDTYDDLIISEIEHDALWEATATMDEMSPLRVDGDGLVDLGHLGDLLAAASHPLVAVMLANNETGVVQPVAQVAARVREAGGLLLVDASQAVGRIPVDIGVLDASYLVMSSHKTGGPPGAGALVLAPGAPFAITRRGGGQEQGRRPGTENVPALAGFGAAMEAAATIETSRVQQLRELFEKRLRRDHADVVIFGAEAPRLPNTSLFALPGTPAELALIALDLEGVALSSGSACSSGKVKSSRVLLAMGVESATARCALRASFGWASSEHDVERLLAALTKVRARFGALQESV
ncbi:MAG: cysteine desulfurase [Hyphomonadaceae bacterium]|nr:MAG: cysteine desulfurase [Caulobacteraceae bacterium]MBT9444921.1 cysteine desulfurase [Hyphomonadaceae bacterium]